jgi:hypothetical protein
MRVVSGSASSFSRTTVSLPTSLLPTSSESPLAPHCPSVRSSVSTSSSSSRPSCGTFVEESRLWSHAGRGGSLQQRQRLAMTARTQVGSAGGLRAQHRPRPSLGSPTKAGGATASTRDSIVDTAPSRPSTLPNSQRIEECRGACLDARNLRLEAVRLGHGLAVAQLFAVSLSP